jgi:regulatory protein
VVARTFIRLGRGDRMARIEGIESLSGRGERVVLRLADGRQVEAAYELVARAGLRRGAEVKEDTIRELVAGDLAWRAREAALTLLSYRARSRAELARRLARKEFPPEVVERCLGELEERGFIDDRAFAELFARDRMRGRPKGARRISQELRAKGVDREIAEEVIGEVMAGEEVSEVELARTAAERWRARPGEDTGRARRRLHGFLARRGFGAEAIRTVLDERAGGA